MITIPVYDSPGVLDGRPIGAKYRAAAITIVDDTRSHLDFDSVVDEGSNQYIHMTSNDQDKIERGIYSGSSVKIGTFGQMLAKIALGYAVMRFGLDTFRPLVRNFILNEVGEWGHWVGGPLPVVSEINSANSGVIQPTHLPPDLAPRHDVLHQLQEYRFPFQGTEYALVEVWLLANMGGPRNYVVVGEF